jgi:small subunit ribosomal protein S6
MTRKYELVYVVSPEATEEQVTDLHTQVEAIVQRIGGQIEKTENWGRRRLAYEIGRHKDGTYVLEVIHGGGELMKEIERRLKVSDLVIRYLVVRVDEDQAVIERSREARTATARRRRTARGLPPDRQPGEGQRNDADDDRDDRFDMGGMDRMDRMDRDR